MCTPATIQSDFPRSGGRRSERMTDEYREKKGLSVYMLVKKSVREFMERHP